MAAPSFCTLIDPLYWKFVDLDTKVKRSAICAGVSVVRSARLGSFSSFCSAACTAVSIGTLANSDSTSNHDLVVQDRLIADGGYEVG